MGIIVRTYATYRTNSWEDVEKIAELNRRWLALGKRLGFPPDKFYNYVSGGPGIYTQVGDRHWDSLAAFEEGQKKLNDPENRAIWDELMPLVVSMRSEILREWDPEETDQ